MTTKTTKTKKPAEQVVKNIRRATRRHFSAEDKIRIVLDGLRGEDSIADDTIWLEGQNLRLQSYDTPEPYDDICGGAHEVALAKQVRALM